MSRRKRRERVLNEITAITPQIKDKRRCNIFIDGRFCCGLALETAVKNRLKVGQIITQEALSSMQLESEKNTAFDKALTHITATRKTEKQVRDFLSKKGYLPAVCDYVVEKMRDYDFLNDGEYAEAYVDFASSKKGSRLIKMELKSKGVSEEEIENALENLGEEQELETAKTILEKYMRHKEFSRETLQKAFRHLMSKGFDVETVKSALSSLGEYEEE